MKQVQSQLAQQQKQLKDTQDQLAAAKSDLEGKLGFHSRRTEWIDRQNAEELSGHSRSAASESTTSSICRIQRFPTRRADPDFAAQADSKHQSYDLMMLVDDHQLSKKKVNLYEPIWLHQSDQPRRAGRW